MSDMNMNEENAYRSVGKIRKAHGIRGELFMISFSKQFDWMADIKEATLLKRETNEEGELSEVRRKFKIKRAKDHKVGRILKLEGMNDRNMAELFEGAMFQVPNTVFEKEDADEFYLLQLKGFSVVNTDGEKLAEVTGFSSNNAQDLLVVTNEDGEFEIPYVDQFVEKLDFSNKQLVMKLPEGLLSND